MGFINENTVVGQRNGIGQRFQAGISDVDAGKTFETDVTVPWSLNPVFTYFEYFAFIGCKLDSGLVVHRALPVFSYPNADSLGAEDYTNPNFASIRKGINLVSNDQYTDIVQRMAHSVYRFNLTGWARRAGYQIPIPKLVTVGGKTVQAIPDDEMEQEAGCVVIGNLSGIPVWFARWSLWYTTAQPPRGPQAPPANLAEGIGPNTVLPEGISVPISPTDLNSVKNQPTIKQQGQIK